MSRIEDVGRFYDLLGELERKLGGTRKLADCDGKMMWPSRGVYFFFDPVEVRLDGQRRVIRVGTHALKLGSKTTLWHRLSQHRGVARTGSGDHRRSIFRGLVGNALINSGEHESVISWGVELDRGNAARKLGLERDVLIKTEYPLEIAVSQYIGNLPFLWLGIDDDAGPDSLRGIVERNSIALLSEYGEPMKSDDPDDWLGMSSDRKKVQRSRLWNNNHVSEDYDPNFLDLFQRLIDGGIAKMVEPVTDKNRSLGLFESIRNQWRNGAVAYPNKMVGFQGGGHRCTVYWRPDVSVWGVFEESIVKNRFWICWGIQHPDESFNIVVETNPPLHGVNRRCSGAFLHRDGSYFLGHSGRVGGGRKGIGKKAFRAFTQLNNCYEVQWPDGKITEYLGVGEVGEHTLIQSVADFVYEVARFKDTVTS